MGNIQMTQPCDEHAAMTPALPLMTSVQLAPAGGRIQGISAFATGSVKGLVMRDRSVEGIDLAAAGATDLGVKREVPTYNSEFAGSVRCSLPARPPV